MPTTGIKLKGVIKLIAVTNLREVNRLLYKQTKTKLASALTLALVAAPVWATAAEETAAEVTDEAQSASMQKQIEVLSIFANAEQLQTATGSATLLNEQELEQFEFDDVHRVLQSVPGVYVREEDGFGLRPNIGLRGATTERSSKVAIMEDGVLIAPAPYAAPAAYYFPLMSRMSQVEVFKGPSAIFYGPNTVGGAINFLSRPLEHQYEAGQSAGLDVAVGDFGNQKLQGYASKGFGQFSLMLEGMHLHSDGFKTLDSGAETGFDKQEWILKGSFVPKGSQFEQFVTFKAGIASETSNETYLGLTDADFAARPNHRYAASQDDLMDWEHYQFQLSHYIEFNDDVSLFTQAYHREFDRDWDRFNGFTSSRTMQTILTSPNTGLNASFIQVLDGQLDSDILGESLVLTNNDRRYESQGIESKLSWGQTFWYMDITLDAGLRLHRDKVERDHKSVLFEMKAGELQNSGAPITTITSNQDMATAIASYLNLQLEYGYWTVSAGLRSELIKGEANDYLHQTKVESNDSVLMPGFGVFYKLSSESGLLFGINKGFVPNSPGQETHVAPEQSWNYELGYRYAQDALQAELIGFFNDYGNLKASCSFSSGCDAELDREFNGGEVDVYGLEASLGRQWSLPGGMQLPLRFTYTHTQSEFQTEFRSEFSQWGSVSKGHALPYMPEHQLSLELGLGTDKWRMAALFKYQSAMAEAAGTGIELQGLRTDEIVQLDLSAWYQMTASTKLYAKLDNATDERHLVSRRPFGARPGKPRQWQVGMKLQF